MTDHEKLEYIHHVLQECANGDVDLAVVTTAIEFVEDIRECFFDENGNLITIVLPLELLANSRYLCGSI
jgi:hypothetical protein